MCAIIVTFFFSFLVVHTISRSIAYCKNESAVCRRDAKEKLYTIARDDEFIFPDGDVDLKSRFPKSMSKQPLSSVKLTVPEFLKYLTSHGMSMSDAMQCAGPLLKAGYSSPVKLAELNEGKLVSLGVKDPDVRKVLVSLSSGRKGKVRVCEENRNGCTFG
jgi:hypothetical protein